MQAERVERVERGGSRKVIAAPQQALQPRRQFTFPARLPIHLAIQRAAGQLRKQSVTALAGIDIQVVDMHPEPAHPANREIRAGIGRLTSIRRAEQVAQPCKDNSGRLPLSHMPPRFASSPTASACELFLQPPGARSPRLIAGNIFSTKLTVLRLMTIAPFLALHQSRAEQLAQLRDVTSAVGDILLLQAQRQRFMRALAKGCGSVEPGPADWN
jgi:hypothetical protein